jgi:hypothetical protein
MKSPLNISYPLSRQKNRPKRPKIDFVLEFALFFRTVHRTIQNNRPTNRPKIYPLFVLVFHLSDGVMTGQILTLNPARK